MCVLIYVYLNVCVECVHTEVNKCAMRKNKRIWEICKGLIYDSWIIYDGLSEWVLQARTLAKFWEWDFGRRIQAWRPCQEDRDLRQSPCDYVELSLVTDTQPTMQNFSATFNDHSSLPVFLSSCPEIYSGVKVETSERFVLTPIIVENSGEYFHFFLQHCSAER